MKFIAKSSQIWLGIGRGCNRPAGKVVAALVY